MNNTMDKFDFKIDSFFAVSNSEVSMKEELSNSIVELEAKIKELQKAEEELKKRLLKEMRLKGILRYTNDDLVISFIPPHQEEYFDVKQLKAERPEIYDGFYNLRPINASVEIKIK